MATDLQTIADTRIAILNSMAATNEMKKQSLALLLKLEADLNNTQLPSAEKRKQIMRTVQWLLQANTGKKDFVQNAKSILRAAPTELKKNLGLLLIAGLVAPLLLNPFSLGTIAGVVVTFLVLRAALSLFRALKNAYFGADPKEANRQEAAKKINWAEAQKELDKDPGKNKQITDDVALHIEKISGERVAKETQKSDKLQARVESKVAENVAREARRQTREDGQLEVELMRAGRNAARAAKRETHQTKLAALSATPSGATTSVDGKSASADGQSASVENEEVGPGANYH